MSAQVQRTPGGAMEGLGPGPVSQSYLEHQALLSRVTGLRALDDGARASRLKAAIVYALENSAYYRAAPRWRARSPDEELSTLPFTTREDLQATCPFGFLATGPERLVRYAESTGTSDARCASYVTREDWLVNNLSVSMSWAELLGADDTLAVAVPYELTYVGADIDRVAELLGAAVISIGTNNNLCPWPRVLDLMRSHAVTVLFCAPTRAVRLAQLALERGIDPRRDLQVRKIICVGEHCSDAKRDHLARCWDAKIYNHYGMTEVMAVAVPCGQQALHLCEDRLNVEIVEPLTGAPVRPDEPGELVLTTLAHRAMPLLRYRTGDLVSVAPGRCPCGNPFRAIKQLGRVSDTFQARSGTAYFHQLDALLLSEPGLQPYYSVSRVEGGLWVSVALSTGARPGGARPADELVASLRRRLFERFGVEVSISFEDEGAWLSRIDNSSKPGNALRGQRSSVAGESSSSVASGRRSVE